MYKVLVQPVSATQTWPYLTLRISVEKQPTRNYKAIQYGLRQWRESDLPIREVIHRVIFDAKLMIGVS